MTSPYEGPLGELLSVADELGIATADSHAAAAIMTAALRRAYAQHRLSTFYARQAVEEIEVELLGAPVDGAGDIIEQASACFDRDTPPQAVMATPPAAQRAPDGAVDLLVTVLQSFGEGDDADVREATAELRAVEQRVAERLEVLVYRYAKGTLRAATNLADSYGRYEEATGALHSSDEPTRVRALLMLATLAAEEFGHSHWHASYPQNYPIQRSWLSLKAPLHKGISRAETVRLVVDFILTQPDRSPREMIAAAMVATHVRAVLHEPIDPVLQKMASGTFDSKAYAQAAEQARKRLARADATIERLRSEMKSGAS